MKPKRVPSWPKPDRMPRNSWGHDNMQGRIAALICATGLAVSGSAGADTISTSSRAALFKNQLSVLDNRAAKQYANSVRLQPPRVVVPGAPDDTPAYTGRSNSPYISAARVAARKYGVPEDLFLRLVQQESGWNPQAVSVKGAIGLAQLMPQTARLLGVDASDPVQNLDGGARYLARQFKTFGDWRLALAAYNAGPGAVKKHGGIPPYKETTAYVTWIMGS